MLTGQEIDDIAKPFLREVDTLEWYEKAILAVDIYDFVREIEKAVALEMIARSNHEQL